MSSDITTVNPTTGEPIRSYPRMSDEELDTAIRDCHSAFVSWRCRSLEERAEVIGAIGRELRAGAEEFAALMSEETGKLLRHSREEIELCAGICEYTAENGPAELAEETRSPTGARKGIVHYAPVGVVYGIQPWNFPAYQAVRYSVASLMTGNGVLLKHASNCTGSALHLAGIYERAGLPRGLFGVLRIDHDQSDAVIAHDLVRGVTMTGSADAGRIVGRKAGEALKKSVLELGSNDAHLVLGDADLDLAVETCAAGRLYNNGETCVNAKRFVVVDKVYDAFVERFVERMAAVKTGAPDDEEAGLGPLARKDLRETLHDQVQRSIDAGATLRCGGEIPDGRGFFYPATVLTDVAPGQPAYDEELFGPVASVIRAKDDEDAMRIANDSRFGLGGGIFSRDEERAVELAGQHFDTGMVFINGFNLATPQMPFGGVKDSGYGREHGGFGMKEFANAKAIFVN
ncbi:NAD-dependent succinate-semialdehyde dehydrogenase [Oceanicella sp. SM1341]|uniref:NAD-dependent succinate-semialdehyde dehydrogenase n=1 Tax=Oceanicella sp. SM1341 TaxID=1548889 RepID=UPI000E47BB94|nr:NAD-dependent succinate-semialdehyde dehydrogenase [Oceanicella sp. SM1341]